MAGKHFPAIKLPSCEEQSRFGTDIFLSEISTKLVPYDAEPDSDNSMEYLESEIEEEEFTDAVSEDAATIEITSGGSDNME